MQHPHSGRTAHTGGQHGLAQPGTATASVPSGPSAPEPRDTPARDARPGPAQTTACHIRTQAEQHMQRDNKASRSQAYEQRTSRRARRPASLGTPQPGPAARRTACSIRTQAEQHIQEGRMASRSQAQQQRTSRRARSASEPRDIPLAARAARAGPDDSMQHPHSGRTSKCRRAAWPRAARHSNSECPVGPDVPRVQGTPQLGSPGPVPTTAFLEAEPLHRAL